MLSATLSTITIFKLLPSVPASLAANFSDVTPESNAASSAIRTPVPDLVAFSTPVVARTTANCPP